MRRWNSIRRELRKIWRNLSDYLEKVVKLLISKDMPKVVDEILLILPTNSQLNNKGKTTLLLEIKGQYNMLIPTYEL